MDAPTMSKPLDGILVVALEQAVAAPYCTSRLADAGARVIKVERRHGDRAHGHDGAECGESSYFYFVWTNRGKESIALDLRDDADRDQLKALIAAADVFVQDLAPGAAARLGFGSDALRAAHPQLVTCDISGYGDSGPLHQLKACDLLVQAESGLVAVNGAEGPWGGIGVAVCDISAGMNALIGIEQALLQRERSGRGSAVKVSLFDSAAELMAVPYLQARYGGQAPARVGLRHAGMAPHGAFTCCDGRELVLAIQNDREWAAFCAQVLLDPTLAEDPRFCDPERRTRHREELEGRVQAVFDTLTYPQAVDRLTEAQTAYGAINSVYDLIEHPQLRTRPMKVRGRTTLVPAIPFRTDWEDEAFAPACAHDQHGAALRAEFPPGRA
jgi:crotonobetainyl-CoA:carnitine CoA-transferase CaiB-like acyl-CoA transferase